MEPDLVALERAVVPHLHPVAAAALAGIVDGLWAPSADPLLARVVGVVAALLATPPEG